MVRKYKRTSEMASYSANHLRDAVAAVRGGQSLRGAAKEFGIPPRTLRRHRQGGVTQPGVSRLGRMRAVFDEEFEEELVATIQRSEKEMYGLSTRDVRRLAFNVADKMGKHTPFNKTGMAGLDWLRNFMKRHPALSIRIPISTSLARNRGFNRGAVEHFFEIFRDILREGSFTARSIWNCDETGFTTVARAGKVIATKGVRQVRKMSSAERGSNITALCCMNATGGFIPPLFVFPRCPDGAIGTVNERGSGYIDSALFLVWLKHFVSFTGCTKDNRHVVLLDGHVSHTTLEAIEFACSNGLHLITFPPHCTHRLQPLDRTFFKTFKAAYSRASDSWLLANRGRAITHQEIMPIFNTAYVASASMQSAISGFSAAGLWPLNMDKFNAELCALEEIAAVAQPAAAAVAQPAAAAVAQPASAAVAQPAAAAVAQPAAAAVAQPAAAAVAQPAAAGVAQPAAAAVTQPAAAAVAQPTAAAVAQPTAAAVAQTAAAAVTQPAAAAVAQPAAAAVTQPAAAAVTQLAAAAVAQPTAAAVAQPAAAAVAQTAAAAVTQPAAAAVAQPAAAAVTQPAAAAVAQPTAAAVVQPAAAAVTLPAATAVAQPAAADVAPVQQDTSARSIVRKAMLAMSPPQQKTPKTSARTSTANLLTSSPFKKRVAEKRAQKEKKQATKGTRTKRKGSCVAGPSGVAGVSSPKVSKSTTEPDSDDEELPCIVCDEAFSRSKEQWVACQECGKWAHADCTPGGNYYICHNCESD